MTLVTLHRQAPVAPDASRCRLCDASIAGTLQDHLLVGQPGTAQVSAVVCERCGIALSRLVELCGPDLHILIRGETRTPPPPAESSRLDATRRRLSDEADSLKRTEQALRAEADVLKAEDHP